MRMASLRVLSCAGHEYLCAVLALSSLLTALGKKWLIKQVL